MRTMRMAAALVGLWVTGAQAQAVPPSQQPRQQPSAPAPAEPGTDDERTFYALGFNFGRNLSIFDMSPAELAAVVRGLEDAVGHQPSLVDMEKYGPRVQEVARSRQARANEAFLAKAAKEPGAKRTLSGVIYKEVQPGTGARPRATDTVRVHYRGTLYNGEEFDSSYKRNQPTEFPLNGVIPCWTEGLQRMKVGGKAELTCPAETAYGTRPPPGSKIPPNAVLHFEVELLGIQSGTSGKP